MIKRIRAPLQRAHRHDWVDHKFNRWHWCFERRCRTCGAVEHNTFDDFINFERLETTWRQGPHP